MSSARYSYRILMKLEFSRQIFEKVSNITFHQNPSSGSRVVPRGQTEIINYTSVKTSKIVYEGHILGGVRNRGKLI
jgi:hypothetical protein